MLCSCRQSWAVWRGCSTCAGRGEPRASTQAANSSCAAENGPNAPGRYISSFARHAVFITKPLMLRMQLGPLTSTCTLPGAILNIVVAGAMLSLSTCVHFTHAYLSWIPCRAATLGCGPFGRGCSLLTSISVLKRPAQMYRRQISECVCFIFFIVWLQGADSSGALMSPVLV